MVVICNIHNEFQNLLFHFLDYYSIKGATRFLFGVTNGKANPVWEELHKVKFPMETRIVHSYDGELDEYMEGCFINYYRPPDDEWYIPADLDEFHAIDGIHSFPKLQAECEKEGADYVLSKFVDRVACDGVILPKVLTTMSVFDQFPIETNITEEVMKGYGGKVCLARPSVIVNAGHHLVENPTKPYSVTGKTYHFKWFGNLEAREKRKMEARRSNGYSFYTEGQFLLDHIAKNNGKLLDQRLPNPTLSESL